MEVAGDLEIGFDKFDLGPVLIHVEDGDRDGLSELDDDRGGVGGGLVEVDGGFWGGGNDGGLDLGAEDRRLSGIRSGVCCLNCR